MNAAIRTLAAVGAAVLLGVQAAGAVSMAANQSTIRNFLGGEGGILAFDDDGDNGRIKWVDLNESSLTIHTLSSETNCRDVIISHDGTRVLYVQNENIYAQRLSGGSRVFIGNGVNGFWYRENGTDYIIYCDATSKYGSDQGDTYKQRIKNGIEPDGNRMTIYNRRAMSAGLSANGRWLGETYGSSYAYDLNNGKEYGPNDFRKGDGSKEGQTCNGSMAPDNTDRFLMLVLPHRYFRLFEYKSGSDDWRAIKTYECPSGASDREWQRPEYSSDGNYATAVFTSDKGSKPYDLYLVNLSTEARLKVVNGDIGNSHLYVGSTPSSGPLLSLSASSLSFTAEQGGSGPADQTVTVSNGGSETLSNVSVSESAGWLSVSRSGSGNTQTLTNSVSIGSLQPNTYEATVTISGGGASNTVSYTVTLQVYGPPVLTSITIAPPSASVTPGGSLELTAEAKDQNGDAFATVIDWSATAGFGSLSASSSGSAVSSHAVTFTSDGTEGMVEVIASSGDIADTATIAVSDIHLKINCGVDDINVTGWEQEDNYVDAGDEYLFSEVVDPTGVTNAAPADIYRSCHHRAPHTYTFPVPDGTYTLRLHIVVNSTDRSFTYVAEGQSLEQNWNPLNEAGGTYEALVKDYAVTVEDGDGLELSCSSELSDVFECGIEVIRTGGLAGPAAQVLAPNGGETYSVGQILTIQWRTNDQSMFDDAVVSISPNDGENWYDITGGGSVAMGEADWGSLEWTIPATVDAGGTSLQMASTACLVRVNQYGDIGVSDMSDAVFTIVDDASVIAGQKLSAANGLRMRFHGHGDLELGIPFTGTVTVELYSASGRCVYDGVHAGGTVFLRSVLAGGNTYLVRLRYGDATELRRFVTPR